jgi:hypothetical protein
MHKDTLCVENRRCAKEGKRWTCEDQCCLAQLGDKDVSNLLNIGEAEEREKERSLGTSRDRSHQREIQTRQPSYVCTHHTKAARKLRCTFLPSFRFDDLWLLQNLDFPSSSSDTLSFLQFFSLSNF